MMMSGTRATLVLDEGAELTEFDVRQALKDNGLQFESFREQEINHPGAVYVAKTPKFT